MKRWWRRANRSRTTKAEKPAVPAWSVSIDRRSSAAATERSHGPLVRLSPSRWADRARPCRAHLCRTPPRAYETAAMHLAWPSPNSTVGQSVGGFSTLQISNSVFCGRPDGRRNIHAGGKAGTGRRDATHGWITHSGKSMDTYSAIHRNIPPARPALSSHFHSPPSASNWARPLTHLSASNRQPSPSRC